MPPDYNNPVRRNATPERRNDTPDYNNPVRGNGIKVLGLTQTM